MLGPGALKCVACSGQYYGTPKGWFAALGVAVSKPLLARKMTGLHSVSTYVHEVTAANMGPRRPTAWLEMTIPSFQAEPPAAARR